MNAFAKSLVRATALTALVLIALPAAAQACAVCGPAPGDSVTIAMDNAVLFMLGLVVAVLAGFAGFFYYLIARNAKFAASAAGVAMSRATSPDQASA